MRCKRRFSLSALVSFFVEQGKRKRRGRERERIRTTAAAGRHQRKREEGGGGIRQEELCSSSPFPVFENGLSARFCCMTLSQFRRKKTRGREFVKYNRGGERREAFLTLMKGPRSVLLTLDILSPFWRIRICAN